jgi:hypothetical protein
MAALTADRRTLIKNRTEQISLPVAATTKIYAGSMVAKNAAGDAIPATNTAGLLVVGWADEYVDNTAGAAGDKRIKVGSGVAGFANGGSVTKAHVETTVMVVDDQTVNPTASNSVKAGILKEIDPTDGILFIKFGTSPSVA